jgi:hypothetical protein
MDSDMTFTKALVSSILRDTHREWTVQGFGFLRTYFGPPELPKKCRLNLWDSQFTVPNVSTIHDHPWDFKSLIVAGELENKRYLYTVDGTNPTHEYTTIKTGEGGGLQGNSSVCILRLNSVIKYSAGDIYSQKANEIHETKFKDGTITLNERIGDTEQAKVFWPYDTDWVDAIPRKATSKEIKQAVDKSLSYWF